GIATGFAGPAAGHTGRAPGRGGGRGRGRGHAHDAAQIGTPGYMAPEQAQGEEVGPAADVFAWAAVMTFAASGAPPFGDGAPEELLRRVARDNPDLSSLPSDLVPLVRKAFSKDPQDRPSAADLLLTLMGEKSAEQRSPAPRAAERRKAIGPAGPAGPSASAPAARASSAPPAAVTPPPARARPVPPSLPLPPLPLPPLALPPLALPPLALPPLAEIPLALPAAGDSSDRHPDPAARGPISVTDGAAAAGPEDAVAVPPAVEIPVADLETPMTPSLPGAPANLPAPSISGPGFLVSAPDVPAWMSEPTGLVAAEALAGAPVPPADPVDPSAVDRSAVDPPATPDLVQVVSADATSVVASSSIAPAEVGPISVESVVDTAPGAPAHGPGVTAEPALDVLTPAGPATDDQADAAPATPPGPDAVMAAVVEAAPVAEPVAEPAPDDAVDTRAVPPSLHTTAEPPADGLVVPAVLDIPMPAAEYPVVDIAPIGPDVDDPLDISPTDPLGLGELLEISSDAPPAAEPTMDDLVAPAVLDIPASAAASYSVLDLPPAGPGPGPEDLPDLSPMNPLGLGDRAEPLPDVPPAAEPAMEDLVAPAVLDIPMPRTTVTARDVPSAGRPTDDALTSSPTDPLGPGDVAEPLPAVTEVTRPAADDLVDVVPTAPPARDVFVIAEPLADVDIAIEDLDDVPGVAEITVAEVTAAEITVAEVTAAEITVAEITDPTAQPAAVEDDAPDDGPFANDPVVDEAALADDEELEAQTEAAAPDLGSPAATGAELVLAPRFDPVAAITELLPPDVLAARAAATEIDGDGVIDVGPGWIQETGGRSEAALQPIRIAELHTLWDGEVDLDPADEPNETTETALAVRPGTSLVGPGIASGSGVPARSAKLIEQVRKPAGGLTASSPAVPAVPESSTALAPLAAATAAPNRGTFEPAPLAIAAGSSADTAPDEMDDAKVDTTETADAPARSPGARARARAARRGARRRRITTIVVAAVVALLATLVPLALRSTGGAATVDTADAAPASPASSAAPAVGAPGASGTVAAGTPSPSPAASAGQPPAAATSPAGAAPPDAKARPGVPGLWLQSVPAGVTVTVIAPFDGGSVTSYRVTSSPGGVRSLTKPGIFQISVDGCSEVSVTVQAVGPGGSSPTSSPMKARGCVPPSEPRGLLSIPDGHGHLIINWDTPANVGGNQISLTYDLTIYRTGPSGVTSETVSVTGHSYTRTAPGPADPYFRITLAARNLAGVGPAVLAWGQ
ncbi:hypothetical protein QOZ89_30725, partial [Pseudofrankia sp. BMG5.37]|nr:hypothetical protein [Pseudofrankia sp. BMG5.37]